MTKVTYIEHSGKNHEIDVDDGINLMDAALDNMVPGIDGDCGGVCACATCHVHVDPTWVSKLPPMEATEDAMLELADGRDETSRLACQIKMSPELEGLVLRTPAGQH